MSEPPNRPAAVTPEPLRDGPSRRSRPGAPLEAGTIIAGRYRLSAPIATGGMATVWEAHDEVLTRPVAVKVLHARLAADPEFVARFRREAVAAARLAHPSIVAIYDTCDDPEAIVMELVAGRTLRAELDERRFLPPREAVEIASNIAQALSVAHRAGLVHRDVKPANVLLSNDGQLKVADFGIAKAAHGEDPELPDLTQVGHMVGTAKYLAPEQVSGGRIDPRTDVYALGAVLYEMLCGRAPFVGDNDLATATARLHAMPERPRSVLRTIPSRLDEIVMKALATDPDHRYPEATDLWAALQAAPIESEIGDTVVVGNGNAAGADPTSVAQRASYASAERSWLLPTMLVTLVAVALGLAWILIGGTDARRDLTDLFEGITPGGGAGGSAEPVTGLVASAFDPPPGDGDEGDDEVGLAVDGDPVTAWTTERYDSRALGGLKDGVGIYVALGESRTVEDVIVETTSPGWAGTVHVADAPGATLADWGPAVATVNDGAAGSTTTDVDGATGSFVLLWITDLGSEGGFEFELQELRIQAT